MAGVNGEDRGTRSLWVKFWFINGVAFFIIIFYVGAFITSLSAGNTETLFNNELWKMTPFQLSFLLSCLYLFQEGRLLHKMQMARIIKKQGTLQEFKVLHNASTEDTRNLPFMTRRKGD